MIHISPIPTAALGHVARIRAHHGTVPYLCDGFPQRPSKFISWIRGSGIEWFGIERGNRYVGYVWLDVRQDPVKMGMVLHNAARRKGIGTRAGRLALSWLWERGLGRVEAQVLSNDYEAVRMYGKLGFRLTHVQAAERQRNGSHLDLLLYRKEPPRSTGVSVKVVGGLYFGGPRHAPYERFDQTYDMVSLMVAKELVVDPGVPMNTLLVCNYAPPRNHDADLRWFDKAMALVMSVNGKRTKGGVVRVMLRNNIGCNYGAYSHAFDAYSDMYDYWMFVEEDAILVKDGYMAQAIEQLQDPKVGFVALRQIKSPPKHWSYTAWGAAGVTSREVLESIRRRPPIHGAMPGSLPYLPVEGYLDQGRHVEPNFTFAMRPLGYDIDPLRMKEAYVDWGAPTRRSCMTARWNGVKEIE